MNLLSVNLDNGKIICQLIYAMVVNVVSEYKQWLIELGVSHSHMLWNFVHLLMVNYLKIFRWSTNNQVLSKISFSFFSRKRLPLISIFLMKSGMWIKNNITTDRLIANKLATRCHHICLTVIFLCLYGFRVSSCTLHMYAVASIYC